LACTLALLMVMMGCSRETPPTADEQRVIFDFAPSEMGMKYDSFHEMPKAHRSGSSWKGGFNCDLRFNGGGGGGSHGGEAALIIIGVIIVVVIIVIIVDQVRTVSRATDYHLVIKAGELCSSFPVRPGTNRLNIRRGLIAAMRERTAIATITAHGGRSGFVTFTPHLTGNNLIGW
jgi:hypothetical protein